MNNCALRSPRTIQLIDPEELELQKSLLREPVGEPGSGYRRYTAAMYFHKRGEISLELLEVYRRCCKFDHEDPMEVARHDGIDELPAHLQT